MLDLIVPSWNAPQRVHVVSTTRKGGVSEDEYESLNLALHVGDSPEHVAQNRRILAEQLKLPSAPIWLDQVHGIDVLKLNASSASGCQADASVTNKPGFVCVVMTADCLPVVFCNKAGDKVGVAHAGWRGLANGVLEETIKKLGEPPENLLAWLGPAIGPQAFEVGEEVKEKFESHLPEASLAFEASDQGKWLANIYLLAKQRLAHLGINEVSGGEYCTFSDQERFFSYRRDGVTGRMATLAWLGD